MEISTKNIQGGPRKKTPRISQQLLHLELPDKKMHVLIVYCKSNSKVFSINGRLEIGKRGVRIKILIRNVGRVVYL